MGLTKPRSHQLQNLDYKQAVRAVSITNVTLAGSAPTPVDGVSLALNDRILVTGQSTGSQNGIYRVSVLGNGSNGTWTRAIDADESGDLSAGIIVMVTEGSTYADTTWKLTTNNPITVGSTSLTFEVNTGAGSGTVTSVSVTTANGVSGTVATATTTPALTIALGAITPSAVQVSGLTASQILSTDASKNLTSLAVATYPSLTELAYVKGVTSAIQTQINAKGAGTVTSVAATVPSVLSISGSPITTSGTLAISYSGTALPVANGGTGITSLGTGVATFLGTPSSANLATAVTDETGSGSLVFATLPTFGTTGVKFSGSTSGTTTVLSGATAGTSVLTLPVATDTLVGKATTDTLTNKTLTSPVITGSAPQTTVYTSGSGTYTTPTNARYLHVRMVGAGGGGAAPAGSAVNGSVGGNTTFGTGTASAGAGGTTNDNGGDGGSATLPSGVTGLELQGGYGNPNAVPSTGAWGGNGGSSAFGGAGKGIGGSNYVSGGAGKANTGGGGGGAGGSNGGQSFGAGGGGAGGYCDFIITSPSATYSYGVGAGGAGGNNGSVVGGAGGSGVIYITAYF